MLEAMVKMTTETKANEAEGSSYEQAVIPLLQRCGELERVGMSRERLGRPTASARTNIESLSHIFGRSIALFMTRALFGAC